MEASPKANFLKKLRLWCSVIGVIYIFILMEMLGQASHLQGPAGFSLANSKVDKISSSQAPGGKKSFCATTRITKTAIPGAGSRWLIGFTA